MILQLLQTKKEIEHDAGTLENRTLTLGKVFYQLNKLQEAGSCSRFQGYTATTIWEPDNAGRLGILPCFLNHLSKDSIPKSSYDKFIVLIVYFSVLYPNIMYLLTRRSLYIFTFCHKTFLPLSYFHPRHNLCF